VAARQKSERAIIIQMEYQQIASIHKRGHHNETLAREGLAMAPPTTDPRDADGPAVAIAQRGYLHDSNSSHPLQLPHCLNTQLFFANTDNTLGWLFVHVCACFAPF
jgi:hypothetical protein